MFRVAEEAHVDSCPVGSETDRVSAAETEVTVGSIRVDEIRLRETECTEYEVYGAITRISLFRI